MTTHDQQTETTNASGAGRTDPSPLETEPSTASNDPSTVRTDTSTAGVESAGFGSDPSTVRTDPPTAGTESSAVPTDQSTLGTDPSTAGAHRSTTGADPSITQLESAAEESLFAHDEVSGLRARWDDVQAGFVDDPRECVQKADGLVSDVVDQLTTSFSQARSRLEEQWARGEEASTEDLRLALKRYREFFQRLLAV